MGLFSLDGQTWFEAPDPFAENDSDVDFGEAPDSTHSATFLQRPSVALAIGLLLCLQHTAAQPGGPPQ